jgi:hypothetical protein
LVAAEPGLRLWQLDRLASYLTRTSSVPLPTGPSWARQQHRVSDTFNLDTGNKVYVSEVDSNTVDIADG